MNALSARMNLPLQQHTEGFDQRAALDTFSDGRTAGV
jgi:hypothetical protein